jgi:Asp-tRNA(Asn)/Glu-tRNA(Gln) amidotransferase A subunit family amidase
MLTAPLPLYETASALRQGEPDLIPWIHQICDRIDAVEPEIMAFVPEPNRRARLLEEATELQARFPDVHTRPPLFGALIGVKDIFRVDGFPTQAGTTLPSHLFDGPEAASVTRLKQAGALVAGKTVTTEFAYFQPGPTRNPHNLDHTPGGSSSGSAAGVAAGFFPLALGTQTIGSVVRPASFCGLVGFKPSYDRIPSAGILYFSKALDHVGLFTQDLAGMALAASVLCDGWDESLAGQALDRPPVLAVPDGPYLQRATPEGLALFEAYLTRLAEAGATIKRVPFYPDFDHLEREHRRLMAAQAAREHEAWYAQHQAGYSLHMHAIMETAAQVTPEEMAQAQANQERLRSLIGESLAEHGADAWIAPPATGVAPQGLHTTGDPIMNLPWTNAGVPALTVPFGTDAHGLPFGLQIITPFGQDERLMGIGGWVIG